MCKIMVVDDQYSILESLKLALEDEFEVLATVSGEECLRLVDDFKPNMVLLDYKMEGLNGLELLELLMKKPYRMQVILISAWLDKTMIEKAKELGAVDCFCKPFDLDMLRQRLHQVLK